MKKIICSLILLIAAMELCLAQNETPENGNVTQQGQQYVMVQPYNNNACSQGEIDARTFYKGRHCGSGWTAALTILGSPIIGLIPAMVNSSTTIKEENLNIQDYDLAADPNYYNCYYKEAKKRKIRKNWIAYGVSTVSVILFSSIYYSIQEATK